MVLHNTQAIHREDLNQLDLLLPGITTRIAFITTHKGPRLPRSDPPLDDGLEEFVDSLRAQSRTPPQSDSIEVINSP